MHPFGVPDQVEPARPLAVSSWSLYRSPHHFRTPDVHIQNPSLFRQVTTETRHRHATYAQFCLDVRRLHLDIDGDTVSRAEASAVYTHLLNLFMDESVGLWFAYWCTQTALASAYYQQLKRLNRMQSPSSDPTSPSTDASPFRANADVMYHLLDDGRQTIRIQTCSNEDMWPFGFGQDADDAHHSKPLAPDAMGDSGMLNGWVLANVPNGGAVLHIQKPFRVVRQRGFDAHHTPVCRYVLHVWVSGRKDMLGTYRVAWQQVPV